MENVKDVLVHGKRPSCGAKMTYSYSRSSHFENEICNYCGKNSRTYTVQIDWKCPECFKTKWEVIITCLDCVKTYAEARLTCDSEIADCTQCSGTGNCRVCSGTGKVSQSYNCSAHGQRYGHWYCGHSNSQSANYHQ